MSADYFDRVAAGEIDPNHKAGHPDQWCSTSTVVTIGTYAATAKNAQIIANCLIGVLIADVQIISKAMGEGRQQGVLLPDYVWPCTDIAWHCDSAIAMVIRDLESLKHQTIEIDELGYRLAQIDATLTVIRAAAPSPDGYVCRCLDRAIKSAGVIAGVVADELAMEGGAHDC